MTAELVLHLELDGFEVVNQKETVKDLSGHNHAGELKGNVGIVADDTFGACANFDGDTKSYITVPSAQSLKITGDVTVEAWVYITKATTAWVRVIGKGTFASRSYGLWYIMSGTTTTCLFQRGHGTSFHNCEVTLPTTPLNTWYHLAGVVEGKKSTLYVHDLQGKLITQRELDGVPSGALIDNDSHVTIGHAPSMHAAHAGKVAQARIYQGSLSLAEIERDIGSDRLSLVPFRKSHPIDFRLNDDDDQPVLYIVDDSADAKVAIVKLELTNTSPQAINLPPLASGTGRDHHHFALRFHPGTLSASTVKRLTGLTTANQATVLKEAADWELACLVGATGPVTLYLSYKGVKKSLQPQEQLTLTLHGVSADAGSGSRGTQVELLPHQLTYVGDDAPITGNRMRYLHITNHRGQKNIPLHVWLVDGNNVLNDGVSETTLKLRISNGSGDRDITLNERSSKEASKFVISFDVGKAGEADWALTENAENVEVKHGESVLTEKGRGQGASGTFEEWEVAFPQKTVLAKRGSESSKHVEITLKIKTALPSGHANLYVRYEGIPGYQDGQFILTVEKSPLVFDNKGNMAIGKPIRKVDTPKVDVAGTLVATGHVGIGTELPKAKLEIALEHKDSTTNPLVVRKGTWNYLIIHSDGHVGIGGALSTHSSGTIWSLNISENGRVGIGAQTPDKKLDVYYGELQVTASHNNPTADIGAFYAKDKTKGIGIGSNEIAAIGTGSSQDILITPKGQGRVDIKGSLTVNSSLQVTASHNHSNLEIADAADIGMFYAKDKIQGIGISSNRISAIGTSSDSRHYQNIFIKPKGHKGAVVIEGPLMGLNKTLQVEGNLRVNDGLPIFDVGKRLTKGEWTSQARTLKNDANYRPGCFILFFQENPKKNETYANDLCCLMKRSDDEVWLLTLQNSNTTKVL